MNIKKATIFLAVIITFLVLYIILAPISFDHLDRDKHVTEAEIEILGEVIALYFEDTGTLPEQDHVFRQLINEGYIATKLVPLDAWGKPYKFSIFEETNSFMLWSPGSEHSEYGLIMYYFYEVNGVYQSTRLVAE